MDLIYLIVFYTKNREFGAGGRRVAKGQA